MKILWVTFAPIGRASMMFYNRPTQSGGWVDATMSALLPYLKSGDVQLDVLSLGEKEQSVRDDETGVTYHMLALPRLRGKRYCTSDAAKWQDVIHQLSPDLIQVWGTEFTFGLDILDAAGDIPVCFFIQGVMSSLSAHPLGDLSERTLVRMLGPTAFFKFRSLRKWRKLDCKQVDYEKELVSRAAGLLLDSPWTRAQYSAYTHRFYDVPLAANPCFHSHSWSVENCKKHTLFTVAGGIDPQKGVHNAVLAVAALKGKYPAIQLHIPGSIASKKPHFLYDSVYIRHLRKLIRHYGLEENILFTGTLSQEQMAQHLESAHVFVMPSCVENHSSTLREAMTVGTPCVSAAVGCVTDLIEHKENGYLYRYSEPQTLAYYIDRLFQCDDLAKKIGENGKLAVTDKYPQNKIGEMLMSAYRQMIHVKAE